MYIYVYICIYISGMPLLRLKSQISTFSSYFHDPRNSSRTVEKFLGENMGGVSFGGGEGLSTINSRYPLEFCFNEFSLLCFKIINLINILSLLRSIK